VCPECIRANDGVCVCVVWKGDGQKENTV